jgi:hypothetical protein
MVASPRSPERPGERRGARRRFLRHAVVSSAAIRLFGIPYAGGSASVYCACGQIAPRQVEVCAVELPGRGSRIAEAPFVRLMPLVRALGDAIARLLDRPLALFGSQQGRAGGVELAPLLRQRGLARPGNGCLGAGSVAAHCVRVASRRGGSRASCSADIDPGPPEVPPGASRGPGGPWDSVSSSGDL